MSIPDYYWVLTLVTFLTAIVSASVGFLGGTILISVMAQFLPPLVLIPLHGLVQLWSNGTRAAFLTKSIRWDIVGLYALGTGLGTGLASLYVLQIPESLFSILMAVLILVLTFVPREWWSRLLMTFSLKKDSVDEFHNVNTVRDEQAESSKIYVEKNQSIIKKIMITLLSKWSITGFISSFAGLFVGAVGVLVGAVFLTEKNMDKKNIVATQAACQGLVHLSKVVVFIYLGFQIGPWIPLLLLLVVSTLLGSYVGTRILDKIPEALFLKIFKGIILLLSLRLIYLASL